MSANAIECKLGFTGAVRVKAMPAIRLKLTPPSSAVTITQLKTKLVLSGTCDNVRAELPCFLTWILQPEGTSDPAKARRVHHRAPVVIVPESVDGQLKDKAFELKVKSKSGTSPLELDILSLGLYGRGRLGCEVQLAIPDSEPALLAPEHSQISIDMQAEIELLDLMNRPIADTSALKVGTQVRVIPKFSSAFDGKRIRVSIRETGKAYSGKSIEHSFERTLPVKRDEHWEGLVLGFDGTQFDYRNGAQHSSQLEYTYSIQFMSKADVPLSGVTPVTASLLKVTKPKLESLQLSMRRTQPFIPHKLLPPVPSTLPEAVSVFEQWVLYVEGKFSGFETTHWNNQGQQSDFLIPVDIWLFVRTTEWREKVSDVDAGQFVLAPKYEQHPPKHLPVGHLPFAFHVRHGEFSGELDLRRLYAEDWAQLNSLDMYDIAFFAVLRFSTKLGHKDEKLAKGELPQPVVFADVVEYNPNEPDEQDVSGFTPMGKLRMMRTAYGTGVCSNLVDIKGGRVKLGFEGSGLHTEWTLWKPQFEPHQNDYNDLIQEAADSIGFDPLLYKSMIAQESAFNPRANNSWGYAGVSQAGPSETRAAGYSIGNSARVGDEWVYDQENDQRFQPAISIKIGAHCLAGKVAAIDKMIQAGGYTVDPLDRMKMLVSAYNIGQGVVRDACLEVAKTTKTITWAALRGNGSESSPLWKGITKNPSVLGKKFTVKKKYEENTEYVEKIFARLDQ